jgi:hypothetical protein
MLVMWIKKLKLSILHVYNMLIMWINIGDKSNDINICFKIKKMF